MCVTGSVSPRAEWSDTTASRQPDRSLPFRSSMVMRYRAEVAD